MGILIDIILIAILLISAFSGYKRGLVKLGANLFAGIIAIVVTLILFRPIAGAIIKNTTLDEKIKISSNIPEIGNVEENISALKNNNENIKIAFSSRYMMDALKAFNGDKVTLCFNGEIKPIILRSDDNQDLTELILPIRTY